MAGANSSPTSLPDEIMYNEILLRLPLKSVAQFKCVCKSWYNLFTDPGFFIMMGRDYHRKLLFIKSDSFQLMLNKTTVKDLVYPVLRPDSYITILFGSCNGLLCFNVHNLGTFIWNPLTNQCNQLPKSNFMVNSMDYYGFGYDSYRNDYILLKSGRDGTELYSRNKNSWRRLMGLRMYGFLHLAGIFCSGCLHWYESKSAWEQTIACFDLSKEDFREVSLPDLGGQIFHCRLGVLDEWLCLMAMEMQNNIHERTVIWVMKDYGVKESWNKCFTISSMSEACGTLEPLCLIRKGEIWMQIGCRMYICNLEKRQFSAENPSQDGFSVTYVESFESPVQARMKKRRRIDSRKRKLRDR